MNTIFSAQQFAPCLIAWQQQWGRHTLPWQSQADAQVDVYPIWLSEIMLQQTQVETVIPYFQRFLVRFPDVATLAAADEDSVLGHWSGLGYYSRARNLHAAARRIMAEHGGHFPREIDAILALPGIGRSTAAAISAFAFGQRCAILDGNVKRVLARVFGIEGWPGDKAVENRLWALAESLLPQGDARAEIRAYTQGLMDLGATVCKRGRPDCAKCPFTVDCVAHKQGRQRELPAARPKKSIPEKSTAMLVLLRAGTVLLEKRPNNGIWGGLWSFPEFPTQENPLLIAARLGYDASETIELPSFTHTFTHFRLTIQPWCLHVGASAKVAEPGQIWLALEDLEGAALPTPVRRILAAISND